MVTNTKLSFIIGTVVVLIASCGLDPNGLASAENENSENMNENFIDASKNKVVIEENASTENDLHKVVANEVLYAQKYVYINVNEGVDKFWIATLKKQINVGATYYYSMALLKTNFESKEFNKLFDRIYLVSNLVGADHASHVNMNMSTSSDFERNEKPVTNSQETNQFKGSIKIAELVKNPEKYEGKTVQVSGKCIKINPNIMNRNWIHVQDGSKDDFDLVMTSETFVPEGANITFRAVVGLNKDFGAGYAYKIILENGTIMP